MFSKYVCGLVPGVYALFFSAFFLPLWFFLDGLFYLVLGVTFPIFQRYLRSFVAFYQGDIEIAKRLEDETTPGVCVSFRALLKVQMPLFFILFLAIHGLYYSMWLLVNTIVVVFSPIVFVFPERTQVELRKSYLQPPPCLRAPFGRASAFTLTLELGMFPAWTKRKITRRPVVLDS